MSRERVGSIIHEDLNMRKLSAKWVLKYLNADQKRQRCQSSEQLLEFFRRDPNDFLSQLVTMDETWLYHYDPETKQQSMEWRHSGSPRPKKFRVQKSAGKVLASIFLDQDGIFLIDYLPKSQTIKMEYYSAGAIEGHFEGKTPREGHEWGLVLSRQCPDSQGTLATQKKLGFQCLDHPPYSQDLAPSDYHLFPGLKKQLQGRNFSSDSEVIAAAETWLDGQPSELFFEWLAKVRATG